MDWLTAERASICFRRALLTADGCRGSQLNDGDTFKYRGLLIAPVAAEWALVR